ncbi:MAG TPA: L,D-transpeptidase family protein [Xanthobacteraceae bacterium]|nr:L,D-transpeptidase family protein [Xanthobacteraceae bacterium]
MRKTQLRKSYSNGTALRLVRVTPRPGRRSQGWLKAGNKTFRVALGRSGIRALKREGDGGTPTGTFRPVRLWWRADRLSRPMTRLPVRRIMPDDAWCEDPSDRRYNRAFKRSANEPGDRLRRDDGLYDLIIEIDHNTRPRVAKLGSAVFIHVARAAFGPTAGCVALRRNDLLKVLARIGPKTRIQIHY